MLMESYSMYSCLVSFTQDHDFKFYPCYTVYPYFVHFYGSVVCQFMMHDNFLSFHPFGGHWFIPFLELLEKEKLL